MPSLFQPAAPPAGFFLPASWKMLIHHNDIAYECDESYSFKDMTGWDLADRRDMDGKVIFGSCLAHETPGAPTLPANLKGATFIRCNLDNVRVPAGNTVIDCSTRRIKAQNDGEDWVLDASLKPVEPVNKKHFMNLGLSTDPKDIPKKKLDRPVTAAKIEEIARVGAAL